MELIHTGIAKGVEMFNGEYRPAQIFKLYKNSNGSFVLVSPQGTNHSSNGRNKFFHAQSILNRIELFYGKGEMFKASEKVI